MSEVSIDLSGLGAYAQRIKSAEKKIKNIESRIFAIEASSRLPSSFGSFEGWNAVASVLGKKNSVLQRCSGFLENTRIDYSKLEEKLAKMDASTYRKPQKKSVFGTIYDGAKAVYKGTKKVVKKTVQSLKDSYNSHGWLYYGVQIGKAVFKGGIAVAKIGAGIATFATTLSPVAVLSVISGFNDLVNVGADMKNLYDKNYDEIGKTNYLKSELEKGGAAIGGLFGNEELGRKIGGATYFGMDLITSLDALDKSYEKLKKLRPTDLGKLRTQLFDGNKDGLFRTGVKLMNTNMDGIKYQAKLFSYTESANLLKNAKSLYNVGEKAYKVGKAVDKEYSLFASSGYENKVLKKMGDVKGTIDKVKKPFDITGKIVNYGDKFERFEFDTLKVGDAVKKNNEVVKIMHPLTVEG